MGQFLENQLGGKGTGVREAPGVSQEPGISGEGSLEHGTRVGQEEPHSGSWALMAQGHSPGLSGTSAWLKVRRAGAAC